jgi:hypothetical protein
MFEELYEELPRLEQFMGAMTGLSRINFEAFAMKFDFSPYQNLCDIGGATGLLCIEAAKRHAHLKCVSFDLPPVAPIAQKHIAAAGLSDRICTASGDFFKDPLPKADLITMGMILHDWNLEKKLQLIRAAYNALPPGGALVAIEALIDDARRENLFGLLMSLNMLIEFGDAFDYSGADFRECAGKSASNASRPFTSPVHPARQSPLNSALKFKVRNGESWPTSSGGCASERWRGATVVRFPRDGPRAKVPVAPRLRIRSSAFPSRPFFTHVQNDLDAREVHAHVARQSQNHFQPLQIVVGVEPRVALRTRRLQQPDAFIKTKCLRVQFVEFGHRADHVAGFGARFPAWRHFRRPPLQINPCADRPARPLPVLS